ncbi:hypothetical protein C2G38_2155875 [Gigaspora rosea]|uniref:TLDc domain-containing protein n=1 Tax=Gigaspora rosea TaxID=44941 RepID=A0A397W9Q5_9GLOM|nr:hypothetical protein C2G38_2155875 [Gigaspora rosea]
MKFKGTDEIFGGYNPISWDKSGDVACWNCKGSYENELEMHQISYESNGEPYFSVEEYEIFQINKKS